LTQRLETIQLDAALTCPGALLSTTRNSLLDELGWNTLAERRKNHKLTLYYKIANGLTPQYLQERLPPNVSEISNYPLRNARNRSLVRARTTRYKSSFFPSTTVLWNNLADTVRFSPSLITFKSNLNNTTKLPPPPEWLYTGSRYANILHTRLRLNNPALNAYLFRTGRSPSCSCECGYKSENIKHFVLDCPRYAAQRGRLLADIRNLLAPGIHPNMLIDLDNAYLLKLLMQGSDDHDNSTNISICNAFQYFIISTGRFSK